LGMSFHTTLLCFLVFNFLAALLAIPVGKLSDRFGKRGFLAIGWLIYSLCYAIFGLSTTMVEFAITLCLYGAFYGFTEGVEKALLADILAPEERGFGFGAFQVVLGASALPASLLMGGMITHWGSK
jgi:MFS family permease